MAKHAIFALSAGTDELGIALMAGAELLRNGDDVRLYGTKGTEEAADLEGVPRHEIDPTDVAGRLETLTEEFDSVLVADLLPTVTALSRGGALDRLRERKLVVLDPFDITGGERVLDVAWGGRVIRKGTAGKRLVPSPCAPPTARGAFRAIPQRPPGDPSERRSRTRRALGVGKDERLLLVVTNAVQLEGVHDEPAAKHLLRRVVRLLGERVAALDGVRVVHVAPAPWPWAEVLEGRYTWLVPPGSRHLHNRFAAADAVLVLDAASWSIAWAACWRVPAMVVVNGIEVKKAGETPKARFTLTERTRAWLADSVPLPRFRICPLGFFEALMPSVAEPPYVPLELLDEASFVEVCRALLFEEGERKRVLDDVDGFVQETAELPTCAELWSRLARA